MKQEVEAAVEKETMKMFKEVVAVLSVNFETRNELPIQVISQHQGFKRQSK